MLGREHGEADSLFEDAIGTLLGNAMSEPRAGGGEKCAQNCLRVG